MEKLVLIGAGGYAKSVLDSVDYYNYEVAGFIDEFSEKKEHLGHPILARRLDLLQGMDKYVFFISIGNNRRREIWYERLCGHGLRMINVVDKSSIISPHAVIGNGCFVGKMAIVNSGARIGDNCIVNTKSLIEHGCRISDHANISTNTVLNGDVRIGTGSFIGSSSVIIGQLEVGEWSTVGAGAVVTKNVRNGVTVAGVPAAVLKEEVMLG